ncbi:hypothetical protein [Alcaligenes sp. Lyrl_28]|uniref:hypothetical protein n=1 Tax=Alcaligenes sp. Lyrl_28 TaxID=3110924 RepID=UPI003F7BA5F6
MYIRSGFVSVAAGVAVSAAAWAGLLIYGGIQYRKGQADCQTAQYVADLRAFREESERLTLISTELQGQINLLSSVKPTVIERYTRVEVEKPLPADCRIDPERLRRINEGIRAANTTR